MKYDREKALADYRLVKSKFEETHPGDTISSCYIINCDLSWARRINVLIFIMLQRKIKGLEYTPISWLELMKVNRDCKRLRGAAWVHTRTAR